ncbi:hypothetical protein [Variovorax sp. OV700]|uniref:hypothetical protein n=1 Tax=Variovorax sp. OV700 TaxID=1882826 RepID=UPI000880B3F0|nr:hypothetical protein [Variovorax sp. OV700]SDI59075.1 hypothetical protein SAMN05444748_1068 [Variovorax sp. OV700]
MNTHFQRHETVPPHTRNLAATDQFKWSAEFEVPAIGTDVLIRINDIGRAQVVGYATQDGYLGVMTVPYSPPAWWVRQNGPAGLGNPALAFGAKISPVTSKEKTP